MRCVPLVKTYSDESVPIAPRAFYHLCFGVSSSRISVRSSQRAPGKILPMPVAMSLRIYDAEVAPMARRGMGRKLKADCSARQRKVLRSTKTEAVKYAKKIRLPSGWRHRSDQNPIARSLDLITSYRWSKGRDWSIALNSLTALPPASNPSNQGASI